MEGQVCILRAIVVITTLSTIWSKRAQMFSRETFKVKIPWLESVTIFWWSRCLRKPKIGWWITNLKEIKNCKRAVWLLSWLIKARRLPMKSFWEIARYFSPRSANMSHLDKHWRTLSAILMKTFKIILLMMIHKSSLYQTLNSKSNRRQFFSHNLLKTVVKII